MKPKVLVLRTAGTNCEAETAYAFELVGADTDIKHINCLREEKNPLADYQFIAIPGGFSYGDDIASGRIFANELMSVMRDVLLAFIERGGYIIGICNGFQTLVKSGILPRCTGEIKQTATLTDNVSGLYTDRWVSVQGDSSVCAWIPDDEPIELPVAHAEGRFTAPASVLTQLADNNQIALRYCADTSNSTFTNNNFNGSDDAIAGICDPTGRVFGLMPHPERFLRWENHPQWTRLPHQREGAGVRMFRTAVQHAQES